MDNDMLNDFYIEAGELFDEAEDSLLAVEKTDDYQSCYNSIFRAFHSVKGAAGMFGIERLQEHMHFVENLLESKKDLDSMSSTMVDYLLAAVDSARKILKGEDIPFEYYDPDSTKADEKPTQQVDSELSSVLRETVIKRAKKNANQGVIFVVDDEPEITALLSELLTAQDYIVHGYTSAKAALVELNAKNPDLIITDIKMPEMNGIELMQNVNKVKPHLPVIVVSGFVTKEVCLDAFACGVAGIMEKPYDADKLASMTQVLINRFQNIKLLNKSIDLLVYQFEDFDKFLFEKFGAPKRDTFREELRSLLKQKKNLFENLN